MRGWSLVKVAACVVAALFGVSMFGAAGAVLASNGGSAFDNGAGAPGGAFGPLSRQLISTGGGLDPFSNTPRSTAGGELPSAALDDLRSAGREKLERAKAAERGRDTPSAKIEREQSVDAHDDLSDTSAVALLRSEFGSVLKQQVPDGETLLDGAKASFSSDTVASLAPHDGVPARLIDSAVPLRAADPDAPGDAKRPTDLDVVASEGHFEPDNGAVRLELPQDANTGIKLGPVTIEEPGQGEATRVDNDTLAYPNVAKDADLVVSPTPTGVESFQQIRSEESPETQRITLKLPAGAELRENDGGGADVWDGDTSKLNVAPPAATDAQGRSVKTSLSVDGDVLVIDTPHVGKDVAYPILVDPTYTVKDDWGNGYGSGNNTDTWYHGHGYVDGSHQGPILQGLAGYWSYIAGGPSAAWGASKSCLHLSYFDNCGFKNWGGGANWNYPDPGYSYGLTGANLWAGGGTNVYAGGSYQMYRYTPPGTTTQIYRTDFGAKFIRRFPDAGNLFLFNGIISDTTNDWGQSSSTGRAVRLYDGSEVGVTGQAGNHRWDALYAEQTPGTVHAEFGMINPTTTAGKPSGYVLGYMGAAIIQLSDPEAPTLGNTAPTGVTGWAGPNDTFTFSPQATDAGLGVRSMSLSGPGITTQKVIDNCTGSVTSPCATNGFVLADGNASSGSSYYNNDSTGRVKAPAFKLKGSDAPEGITPVTVSTDDALGDPHLVGQTQNIKVDLTPPAVDVDGPLNPEDRPWVGPGKHSLLVNADDAASGVTSILPSIDGRPIEAATTQDCPNGGCSLTREVTLDTDDVDQAVPGNQSLSEGTHTISVEVKDGSGKATVKSWTIRHDRTPPSLNVSGTLKASQGQMLAPGTTYDLSGTATDGQTADSGMGQIDISVDGTDDDNAAEQRCLAGGCSLSRRFDYQSSDYAPGPHQVQVTATDEAGNSSNETVTVNTPNDPPSTCATQTSSVVPSSDVISGGAALDLLGSAAGVPEATRGSQALDLGYSLIQPALTTGGSGLDLAQSFITGQITSTGAQAAVSRIDTPDGPICMTPTRVASGASTPLVSGSNGVAMLANALPATDSAVRATANGIQMLSQARSGSAPLTNSWTVELPEGQGLRNLSDGSVAVVRSADPGTDAPALSTDPPAANSVAAQREAIGKPMDEISQGSGALQRAEGLVGADDVVALFRSPWAKDSSGQPVPVSLSGAGQTLTLASTYTGSSFPIVSSMNADSASATDQATNASPEAQSPEWDDADDTAFEASEPDGDGVTPSGPAYPGGEQENDSSRDYSDFGSAAAPSTVYDDGSETPPGAAAPDPTSSDPSAASASSLSSLAVGVSDSSLASLGSNDLRGLAAGNPGGKQYLRVFVPWNYMAIRKNVRSGSDIKPCHIRAINAWEGSGTGANHVLGYRDIAKHLRNTEVMVVFSSNAYECDQSARDSATYKKEIKAFLDDPGNAFVQRISPFNEPNYYRGLKNSPERAAEYWKAARALCAATVSGTSRARCGSPPAGDFAMAPGTIRGRKRNAGYVDAYARQIRTSPTSRRPTIWSFHPWADTRGYSTGRLRPSRAPRFIDSFRRRYSSSAYRYKKGSDLKSPAIWNTETGAQYRMDCKEIKNDSLRASRCKSGKILFFGQKLQAKTAAFLLRASTRDLDGARKVSRLYYYNFQDGSGPYVGGGYAGRCRPAGSILTCPATDTGLLGIDSATSATAQDSVVTDFPGSNRSTTVSAPRARRLVWCLLRFRDPVAVKYGSVKKCG